MHPTRKTRTNAPLFSDRTNASSPIFFGGCFGELFLSKRNNEFDSICKFAAKELDNETNYTYFGARYGACSTECGNRDISIWLSVDPLSDKYPSLSPYNYCANNPIKYVDPDGREIVPSEEAWVVINNSLNSTLGKENNPFYFDDKTKKMKIDETKKIGNLCDVQQEILDKFTSLVKNEDYITEVSLVGNDDIITLFNGEQTTLRERQRAWGIIDFSDDGKSSRIFISREPLLRYTEGITIISPQTRDDMAITSIHEIGGHAYYHSKGVTGNENREKTTEFERRARSIWRGSPLKNYIKKQEAIRH